MSNDNTKVNELGQQILDAIDIIALSRLNSISFDKTITCTITNDEKRKEGEYEVSDGSVKFKAYSTDDGYRKDDVVYVTIPQGDYNNQKLIVSKKTDDIVQPMIFKMPFDNIFDMTGNLAAADGQSLQAGMLLANDVKINAEGEVVLENNLPNKIQGGTTVHLGTLTPNESNFTRFGVRADFKTWLAEAIEGTYGLKFEVTTQTQGTVDSTHNNNQVTNTSKEDFYFTNIADMYGNTYNYESYYSQEKVFTLTNQGKITQIDVYFFQLGDFKDKNKQDIKATDSFNSRLWENIYVDNLYLCLGYDLAVFNDDYVEIYTENSKDYARSTDTADTEESINERNTKEIKMRWVHIDDNGDPVDMSKVEEFDKTTEIRWYRYRIGAAAADNYSGVYWERIEFASGMTHPFIPDVNNQQEKIKAVILYNIEKDETTNTLKSGIPYHSNELVFENQEILPPGETAQHIANALQIIVDDGTNGNYLIYGQDNSIKDTKWGDEVRTLSAKFDTNNDGEHESEITDLSKLTWIFPTSNTMIQLEGNSTFAIKALIGYEVGKYYLKNEDDIYSISNEDFDINKVYYKLKTNSTTEYERIDNFYKPNTYYKLDYIGQYGKTFQSNVDYYKLEDNNYQLIGNITIEQFNQQNESNQYYLQEYNFDNSETITQGRIYYYYNNKNNTITGEEPKYKIRKTYSPNYTNNTITCQYILNGVTYNSEIEFTFGSSGTMGTDQTLVIDFVGDTNAIKIDDLNTSVYHLKVRIYDKENKELTDNPDNIIWSWYHTDGKLNLSNTSDQTCVITLNKTTVNGQEKFTVEHGQLYIIKVKVGDLETYYPIALKSGDASYIEGPTQIIYMSDGTINYQNVPYKVFKADKSEISTTWEIIDTNSQSALSYKRIVLTQSTYIKEKYYIKNDDGTFSLSSEDFNAQTPYYQQIYTYIGNLENGNKLKPLGIYVENAPIYGVKCSYWTQPILVLQNRWGNSVLNKWDGEQLVIDESNGLILANAISAGRKEDDNSFTGVIIGDWGKQDADASIIKNTGVYGFHEGGMCYAFKDNGEAFIGKSGLGRINFDGNKGYIASQEWLNTCDINGDEDSDTTGMKIDLTNNKILLNSSNSYLHMDSDSIDLKGSMYIHLNNSNNYGFVGQLVSNVGISGLDQESGVGLTLLDANNKEISGFKATSLNSGLFHAGVGYLSITKNKKDEEGNIITNNQLEIGSPNLIIRVGDKESYESTDLNGISTKFVMDASHIGFAKSGVGWINFDSNGLKMRMSDSDDSNIVLDKNHAAMQSDGIGWISVGNDEGKKDISIGCGVNDGTEFRIINIPADKQHGIYARFA